MTASEDERAALVCDLSALDHADLATVEAVARLQLTARRLGVALHFCCPPPELGELLRLFGLDAAVPLQSGVQPGRQTEEREEPCGVEERVHRHDPPC